jgi:hypothetical protein
MYWVLHYEDEMPYKVPDHKIISFAQDEGYQGDDINEAIEFLHDIGNLQIWADDGKQLKFYTERNHEI